MILFNPVFITSAMQIVVVFSLLIIVYMCFIKYIMFKSDIDGRGTQKIIGGLTVFIVAIVSQNPGIMFVSLFIGGLIIASEEFMQKLAIIIRSRSEDIGRNLEFSPATNEEIDNKRTDEIKESSVISKKTIRAKDKAIGKLKNAEDTVHEYFRTVYGGSYLTNLKFEFKEGIVIVDGAVINPLQKKLSDIIEIKYMNDARLAESGAVLTLDYLRSLFPTNKIIICIVSDRSLSNEREIERLISKKGNAEVLFFRSKT